MNIRARHPIYMTKILHHIVSNIKTVFIMKMVWVFEKIICFSNHTKNELVHMYTYICNEVMNLQKKQKVWHSYKHYTYCSNDKSKQTHMPDKKTCGILKFLLRRCALFFWRARFCEEKFIGISFEIVKMLFQSRNRKRTLKSHKMLLLNEQMPK